jgi:hypothetical protein
MKKKATKRLNAPTGGKTLLWRIDLFRPSWRRHSRTDRLVMVLSVAVALMLHGMVKLLHLLLPSLCSLRHE